MTQTEKEQLVEHLSFFCQRPNFVEAPEQAEPWLLEAKGRVVEVCTLMGVLPPEEL